MSDQTFSSGVGASADPADHAAPAGQFVHFPDSPFELYQPYPPAGDQPTAIAQLCEGIEDGLSYQTLLGVTGSGKTYTMAVSYTHLTLPTKRIV